MAGYVAVAALIAAAALHFRGAGPAAPEAEHVSAPQSDPLAAELSHCQSIGMAAQDDEACTSAWAENRRRFFTYQPTNYPQTKSSPDKKPHPRPEGQ
jgi:conjugative transfer region protein TrbK